ncbi:conserved phage C-terminal domain-containing protein [Staphylococcus auricularis]|uniref:Replication protein n=1 Tax=Staphylococcus auricularis TaxID=29379 RepID=A0ABX5IED1_9STAP|nr:conserved phage C-terminal domain-containing protein [Staphylococcus auricularis]PTH16547.1 replication protein [Staphylococcus auricularis]
MGIIRAKKTSGNYFIASKHYVEDETLSWKAKGLMTYLFSKPDHWKVHQNQLVKVSTDGKDSVRAIINELIAKGYMTRDISKKDNGCFDGYEYTLYENPRVRKMEVAKMEVAKMGVAKMGVAKSDTSNNDLSNNDLSNNDLSNNDSRVDHGTYKEIIEYLNKETDKHFNFKAKANQELIKARFNEGYEKADFFKVIDNKVSEWLDVDKMKDYLQPSTLFRKSNFDKYLNQTVKQPTKEANVLDKLMKEE